MKKAAICKIESHTESPRENCIADLAVQSFKKIAPFWPLKNLIAVNPLQGFEDLPIEAAVNMAAAHFETNDFPEEMDAVNRETIKWLQAYFDDGQATLSMPFRTQGLYASWRKLAIYDEKLHKNDKQKKSVLRLLPKTASKTIAQCLLALGLSKEQQLQFLSLMLTTLPGWAGYIKYRTEWAGLEADHPHPVSQEDYLAVRLVITMLLWPKAKSLIDWHKKILTECNSKNSVLEKIQKAENAYRIPLLNKLAAQPTHSPHIPEAQLVFCIDVRSEPFRRALESTGDYQTFGFAGFFGIPLKISNMLSKESYASCPVLLQPKHEVKESPCINHAHNKNPNGYERLTNFKKVYQSLKYNFTTPFALVESLGIMSGLWMGLRSFAPGLASKLKNTATEIIYKDQELKPSLENISFAEQCSYAEGALKMMGLTHHFAKLIVLCGHGSTTQNNAYATALDCGACGGRHGASNARILAAILNRPEIRVALCNHGIKIPKTTNFIAAEHNTTTDEVTLYGNHDSVAIQKLKDNLEMAKTINNSARLLQMQKKSNTCNASTKVRLRSQDWAQLRPEWGLARNAAFIVGPRDITASLNLEGRCFLHSYDYKQDEKGSFLTTILTAPMVVAQWINMQYLFSTYDNVAYGGGSKITKNITGKIGIMQGNASDLMTGLPLQSVYSSDTEAYHEIQRLMTVVFAPRKKLDNIIRDQAVLGKLLGNGWVQMACIEPDSRQIYTLNRDFTWQLIN